MRFKDTKAPEALKKETLLLMQAKMHKANIGRIRPLKFTVVAACILLVFTTTVFALTLLDVDFIRFLQPNNDEQAQYLANGAYIVDKIDKKKTGSIHVKQVIGDSNLTYILFDFIAPRGTILDDYRYYFYLDNIDSDYDEHFFGITQIPDEDTTDNVISFVCDIITEMGSLQGSEIKIALHNLASYETEEIYLTENRFSNYEKSGAIAMGNWEVIFDADFKSYSVPQKVSQKVDIWGYEADVKSIAISPISVTIRMNTEFSEEISSALSENTEIGSDSYPIEISYADGTLEVTEDFNGASSINHKTGEITTVKMFDGVINNKEIVSIHLFGEILYQGEVNHK